jgi:hypothetical protein
MSRHKLSLEEQLEGVKAALRSRRTPAQLRAGLENRAADLEKQLRRNPSATGPSGRRQASKTTALNNRVFVSFAIEDKWAREYLVGQARNERTPFSFTDMSIKEPFDERWKTRCRSVIKGCDGVIALLSSKTAGAEGARWEMSCAIDEQIPIIGIHTDSRNKGAIPSELLNSKVIEWSWDGIARFLNSL